MPSAKHRRGADIVLRFKLPTRAEDHERMIALVLSEIEAAMRSSPPRRRRGRPVKDLIALRSLARRWTHFLAEYRNVHGQGRSEEASHVFLRQHRAELDRLGRKITGYGSLRNATAKGAQEHGRIARAREEQWEIVDVLDLGRAARGIKKRLLTAGGRYAYLVQRRVLLRLYQQTKMHF